MALSRAVASVYVITFSQFKGKRSRGLKAPKLRNYYRADVLEQRAQCEENRNYMGLTVWVLIKHKSDPLLGTMQRWIPIYFVAEIGFIITHGKKKKKKNVVSEVILKNVTYDFDVRWVLRIRISFNGQVCACQTEFYFQFVSVLSTEVKTNKNNTKNIVSKNKK